MDKKNIFLFFAFGCIGIANEVFFTAVMDTIDSWGSSSFNWRLLGYSYIWMAPIYGLTAILFNLFWENVQHFHWVFRFLIYLVGIYLVEFSTGFLLETFVGACPWKYSTGIHLMGYIRLDYAPFWFIFGIILEKLFLFLSSLFDNGFAKPIRD